MESRGDNIYCDRREDVARMRSLNPCKSKALWEDHQYFKTTWNGHTLAENLTYGAEMTCGSSPQSRLEPYPKLNLSKNQLSLGFWSGQRSPNPDRDVQWLKDNGYAGIMIFGFEEQLNVDLMGELVNVWYGSGNWNPPQ